MRAQFIRIENVTNFIPSIELMKMLGASSSRGSDKIGQFGSGFVYSLALMARTMGHEDIMLREFKVCLGKDVYTFDLKGSDVSDAFGNNTKVYEIIMRKQGGGTYPLNISSQFGAVDWQDINMALREFISNAYDGASQNTKPNIELVSLQSCRAKENTIRIYMPMISELEVMIENIDQYFLLGKSGYDPYKTTYSNIGQCKVYRRGVLVGSYGQNSVFSYNLDHVDLNECRVLPESLAYQSITEGVNISPVEHKVKFLKAAASEDHQLYFDVKKFDYYYSCQGNGHTKNYRWMATHRDISPSENVNMITEEWRQSFIAAFGENACLCEPFLKDHIEGKGYKAVVIHNENLARMLRDCQVLNDISILSKMEMMGYSISKPSNNTMDCFHEIWHKLINYGMMPENKAYPGIFEFEKHNDGGTQLYGYYDSATDGIYINKMICDTKSAMLKQTILEEITHYITGENDGSRGFQEFFIKLTIKLMEKS